MTLMREAGAELAAVAERMDEAALEPAVQAIAEARRVMLYGCGREGLMMRALAMRLHHLGLQVCMQGDMNAFPLGPGDLFLCAAGKLGVPPEDCIVVEDSDVGIEAARAAGMKVMRFFDNG